MLVRMWSDRNPHPSLEGMQSGVATLLEFLTRWCVPSSYNSAILLLGVYQRSWKFMSIQKLAQKFMFIAALFIIAKTWKQLRCPLVGEWINKLWSIQTIEYDSALKRNELSSHGKTWSNLKYILLEKEANLYDSNIQHSGTLETVKDQWLPEDSG